MTTNNRSPGVWNRFHHRTPAARRHDSETLRAAFPPVPCTGALGGSRFPAGGCPADAMERRHGPALPAAARGAP